MALPEQLRAVVTGAGSGLGRAFCNQLARRGAQIIAADINVEGAEETVRALPALGAAAAFAMRADVSNPDDVHALAVEAEQRFGGTDVVVNNAGVAVSGRVGEVPVADWNWIVGINLMGVVHGCHEFVPRFRAQRSGHVINVASAAGLVSAPLMAPYNATKAAVVALSETLAAELADEPVKVTVLCPTFFPTNIANAGRGGTDDMKNMANEMMRRSRLDADGVARFALECADAGKLFALPHQDGRWMWRVKRLAPEAFASTIVPRAVKFQAARTK